MRRVEYQIIHDSNILARKNTLREAVEYAEKTKKEFKQFFENAYKIVKNGKEFQPISKKVDIKKVYLNEYLNVIKTEFVNSL